MAETDDVLGRAPLFEALDEEGTKALRAGIHDATLARGDRLFDEGDAGDRLYACCPYWARARCSASCRCSTRGRGPPAPLR